MTHFDANRVFFDCYNHQDHYDLVDVDCFGSPAPYLTTSLWTPKIGGLIDLTNQQTLTEFCLEYCTELAFTVVSRPKAGVEIGHTTDFNRREVYKRGLSHSI